MSVISEWTDAILRWVSPNEVGFDQKDKVDEPGVPQHDDPSKFRFGAWWLPRGKFYIGAIGMDVMRRKSDGGIHREEVGFIKLAVDEVVDGDKDPVPMVEILLCPKVGQSQDADMKRVMSISRKGVNFYVPTNISGGAPQKVTRFYTDGGKFCFNFQDDTGAPAGIVYATNGSTNESTWTAIGRIPIDPL